MFYSYTDYMSVFDCCVFSPVNFFSNLFLFFRPTRIPAVQVFSCGSEFSKWVVFGHLKLPSRLILRKKQLKHYNFFGRETVNRYHWCIIVFGWFCLLCFVPTFLHPHFLIHILKLCLRSSFIPSFPYRSKGPAHCPDHMTSLSSVPGTRGFRTELSFS